MAFEMTPEAAAAVAAYERSIDAVNKTTRRPLTVGYSKMIHALDESMDIWGMKIGRVQPGHTYAQALCGQRSPKYNRNFGSKLQDSPVEVNCSKCLKVMANIVANQKAAAEAETANKPSDS